nr:helix-turn-helix domain-containing protein [Azohydromonas caseinilytica]
MARLMFAGIAGLGHRSLLSIGRRYKRTKVHNALGIPGPLALAVLPGQVPWLERNAWAARARGATRPASQSGGCQPRPNPCCPGRLRARPAAVKAFMNVRAAASELGLDSGEERSPLLDAFGERLRTLRARRGITHKALAQAAGVSERYLTHLEHGRGNPSLLIWTCWRERWNAPCRSWWRTSLPARRNCP